MSSTQKITTLLFFVVAFFITINTAFALQENFGTVIGSIGTTSGMIVYAEMQINTSMLNTSVSNYVDGVYANRDASITAYTSRPVYNYNSLSISSYSCVPDHSKGSITISGTVFDYCRFNNPLPIRGGELFFMGFLTNDTNIPYMSSSLGYFGNSGIINWSATNANATFSASVNAYIITIAKINITSKTTENFIVSQKNSFGNKVRTTITAEYPNQGYFYYALSCDIVNSSASYWNENFGYGFNATLGNVSFSGTPSSPTIKYDQTGVKATIDNNPSITFDMVVDKSDNPISNDATLDFIYSFDKNSTLNVFVYDHNNAITDWFSISRNDNTTMFFAQQSGLPQINIANITSSSSNNHIQVSYVKEDSGAYGHIITYNNVVIYDKISSLTSSIGNDNTYYYLGSDISRIEFFTDTTANFTMRSVGLLKYKGLPKFIGFQNGLDNTTNGVEVVVNPEDSELSGQGFVIYPSYNNIFDSECSYPTQGVYTQRHYLSSVAYGDYNNFVDITVGAINATGANDTLANVNLQGGFFSQIGQDLNIDAASAGFLVWLIITLILSITLAVMVSPMVGLIAPVLSFFIGNIFGIVPPWAMVTLFIITAGIVALFFKSIFTSRDSGGE